MTYKPCKECGEVKDLDQFHKHPMMSDGHLNVCMICKRKYARRHRIANIDRIRKSDIERANRPQRIKARINYTKKYRLENPDKYAAHGAVSNALKSGRLTRRPCEVCGSVKVEAHHDDYTKPLQVRWLCCIHHNTKHHQPLPY